MGEEMAEIISFTSINILTTEVATAIGAYVAAFLSIIGYLRKIIREQREHTEKKIEKAIEIVCTDLYKELNMVKQDIEKNDKEIRLNRDRSDDQLVQIKESLNRWKLEIVDAIASLRTAIQYKNKIGE
jgi:hypothetical protein